jgi:hypothetical protein
MWPMNYLEPFSPHQPAVLCNPMNNIAKSIRKTKIIVCALNYLLILSIVFIVIAFDYITETMKLEPSSILWGSVIATGFSQWRGKRDVERLLRGNKTFWRSLLEGFIFGLLLATLVQVILTDIDSESGISAMAGTIAEIIVTVIVAGALWGMFSFTLHLINRLIIRRAYGLLNPH